MNITVINEVAPSSSAKRKGRNNEAYVVYGSHYGAICIWAN